MCKVNNIQLINLPKIQDPRGNLTFIEGNNHIPFEIKRAYCIYDISKESMCFNNNMN